MSSIPGLLWIQLLFCVNRMIFGGTIKNNIHSFQINRLVNHSTKWFPLSLIGLRLCFLQIVLGLNQLISHVILIVEVFLLFQRALSA